MIKADLDSIINGAFDDSFADFAIDVEIYSKSTANDAFGGQVDSWILFASPKAFIFNVRAEEKMLDGRVNYKNAKKFILKNLALNDEMKIVYQSEDYNIRQINDIAEADKLTIVIAEKGVSL